MNYELLLDAVKEVSKDKLKEISFKLDDQTIQAIKEMDLSEDEKRQLILRHAADKCTQRRVTSFS